MDTSGTYIAMCEKAEEIQSQWSHSRRSSGDFYFHKILNCAYAVTGNKQKDSDCIWLPRQDQLQEMVRDEIDPDTIVLLFRFDDWISNLPEWQATGSKKLRTMEQLWLAFVMKEKFGKVWDKENWIKA